MERSVGKLSSAKVKARLISAAIAVPPVIAAIHFGSPFFELLLAAALAVMAYEWWRLCGGNAAWVVAGVGYIGVPILCLAWVRLGAEFGRETVYWMFLLVWAADTGAFVVGSSLGGPRLAPSISPAKTWSGFIGGVISAALVGVIVGRWVGVENLTYVALASAVMGMIAQGGDLLESGFKRHFGVKDAGGIMPGHGGLLDRVDGLLPVAVVAAIAGMLRGGSVFAW